MEPIAPAQIARKYDGYVPKDHGVEPHQDLFREPRVEEDIQELSPWIHIAAATAYILFPPLFCCSVKVVRPMTDSIVTRCGIPYKVWREPGPHFQNVCCDAVYDVNMGIETVEIKDMAFNDSIGNPLVVSAQFVFRVANSVQARFKTEHLVRFIKEQAETALQNVLNKYPFDLDPRNPEQAGKNRNECLCRHPAELDNSLISVLQRMVDFVGVKIQSFRLINVGIQQHMEKLLLAKQEAQAEVTARTAIAEGAAGIVKETLVRLGQLSIALSDAEKSRFARDLTLILVNHGQTTLNLIEGPQPPVQLLMPQPAARP
jgi:regulator of protease activity HflC (stomatin/prohibitin superfamily)